MASKPNGNVAADGVVRALHEISGTHGLLAVRVKLAKQPLRIVKTSVGSARYDGVGLLHASLFQSFQRGK